MKKGLFFEFLKDFLNGRRAAVARIFLITLFLGLSEGIGIFMLIPMLHLLGATESSDLWEFPFRVLGLPRSIEVILLLFVVLVCLRSLLTYLQRVYSAEVQYEYSTELQKKMHKALTYCDWLYFTGLKTSEFSRLLSTESIRVGQAVNQFLMLVSTAVLTLIYFALALMIAPEMTLLTAIVGFVLMFLLRGKKKQVAQTGEELGRETGAFFESLSEHVNGMKIVRSYGVDERYIDVFSGILNNIKLQTMKFVKLQASSRIWFEVGGVVILSLVLWFSIRVLQIKLEELLVLVFVFARILPRLTSIVQFYHQIEHVMPGYCAISERLLACMNGNDRLDVSEDDLVVFDRSVSLMDVSFSYKHDENRPALRSISIQIPAGKTTAIAGASGAGKSTIADLLIGLIKPLSGYICVDDKRLEIKGLKSWRALIAYVPQECFLIHDSIRANVCWFEEFTDEEIRLALSQAAALDFVAGLPEGMDTIVGDRGVRLSGGERQRISLARALLRKPKLLILDEATSALDRDNERKVQEAVDGLHGEVTMVVIAHRLSTIKKADQIVVLEQGRVVEIGNWEKLSRDTTSHFFNYLE